MATRESLGTTSLRISSRLPLSSTLRVDSPVMFPPGRARLAMKPSPTGSGSFVMTMGIVEVASLAARVTVGPPCDDHVYLETDQVGSKLGQSVGFSLRRPPINDNVFSLHIAKLAQTVPERLDTGCISGKGGTN